MDQGSTFANQSVASNEPLPLPHFEEEMTLLSARPVVPLGQVKRGMWRRHWPFALAIVAAVLVGALSATLIVYKHRRQIPETTVMETAQPASNFAQQDVSASGGFATESKETHVSSDASTDNPQTNDESVSDNARVEKIQAPEVSRSVDKPNKARAIQREEEDSQNRHRELRRAERRESRRIAREATHERRDKRGQVSDDLMRIREIFEGVPLP